MARDKCKHEGSAGTKAADTTLTHHATALHTYGLMRDACDRRLMAQICGASALSLLRLDVVSFEILSGACFRATAAVTMSSSLGHRCGAMQCTNATHKARTRMKDCAERSAGRSLSHVREMITRRQTKPAETG